MTRPLIREKNDGCGRVKSSRGEGTIAGVVWGFRVGFLSGYYQGEHEPIHGPLHHLQPLNHPTGLSTKQQTLRPGRSARRRHVFRQKLKRHQAALSLADVPEASFEPRPAVHLNAANQRRTNMLPVQERDHALLWGSPPPPSRSNSSSNHLRSRRTSFAPKSRAHPCAGPSVLRVLSERPRSNPKSRNWRPVRQHKTTPRRNKLRRSRLLAVVVAVGQRKRLLVETMRQRPHASTYPSPPREAPPCDTT